MGIRGIEAWDRRAQVGQAYRIDPTSHTKGPCWVFIVKRKAVSA